MHRFLGLSVAVTLLGCGSVESDLVTGSFGGVGVEVMASHASVVVALHCVTATFPGALTPAPDGTFELAGEVTRTSWLGGIGSPARIRGSLVGGILRGTIEFQWVADEWTSPGEPIVAGLGVAKSSPPGACLG